MRLLLRERAFVEEMPGLVVGGQGELTPVTLRTRAIGDYVEVIVLGGAETPAAAPVKPEQRARPMGRGSVVSIPDGVKESLRDRLRYRSIYEVAEKVGCSASAVGALANGQTECRQALLDALMEYLGDLANA